MLEPEDTQINNKINGKESEDDVLKSQKESLESEPVITECIEKFKEMELANESNHALEEDPSQHLFNQIFSNDLIFKQIASYLSFTDLKILSEVNHVLLSMTRSLRSFADRLKIIISKESTTRDFVSKCTFAWKHADIELTMFNKANRICTLIENVESLELYMAYSSSDESPAKLLRQIVLAAENLDSLSLDCTLLEKNLSTFLDDPSVVQHLSRLKQLYILAGRRGNTLHVDRGPFIDNMSLLGKIPFKDLQVFKIQKIDYGCLNVLDDDSTDGFSRNRFLPPLPSLLCDHRETLVHLHFHISDEEVLRKSLQTVVFPLLKTLVLSAEREAEEIVKRFLHSHPSLTTLDLHMRNGFPKAVLDVIKLISGNLQILKLKGRAFTGSSQPIDWSFLTNLTHLKEFSMFQPRSFLENDAVQSTCAEFLAALPPKVERISLRGLEVGWAGNVGSNTVAALGNFTQLRELSLMRCDGAIGDESLQFICSYFPMLTSLHVSHCRHLTDFGLTGKRRSDRSDSGISLSRLTGLKSLTLKACGEITVYGVLASVQFLALTHLDVSLSFNKRELIDLVSANPSLEVLSLGSIDYEEDDLKEIKEKSRRLCETNTYVIGDWELDDTDSEAEEEVPGFFSDEEDFFDEDHDGFSDDDSISDVDFYG